MLAGKKEIQKWGTAVNAAGQGHLPACYSFAGPGLVCCCKNIGLLVRKLLQVAWF